MAWGGAGAPKKRIPVRDSSGAGQPPAVATTNSQPSLIIPPPFREHNRECLLHRALRLPPPREFRLGMDVLSRANEGNRRATEWEPVSQSCTKKPPISADALRGTSAVGHQSLLYKLVLHFHSCWLQCWVLRKRATFCCCQHIDF